MQLELRLLPDLYAYGISIIPHAYDAIRSLVSTDETTDKTTDGHGRDALSTAVLRAQQSTYISQTFSTTNGRLPDDGTVTMPQRRRSRIR